MIQNLTSVPPHPVADADFPVVFSDICYGPTISWVGQSPMFYPPLVCPETNVSWRAQVCFLLPPSAVAHDDVCKSHKHLSYMAREEMRRQTLAKKQALIALFFGAPIVLLSSLNSS